MKHEYVFKWYKKITTKYFKTICVKTYNLLFQHDYQIDDDTNDDSSANSSIQNVKKITLTDILLYIYSV